MIKGKWQWLMALNPMGGVIKAYRASLLGGRPIDWPLLGLSAAVIFLILLTGLSYFRRMEKSFADVV
jgi:lipopolysaccharide transport system permease protein